MPSQNFELQANFGTFAADDLLHKILIQDNFSKLQWITTISAIAKFLPLWLELWLPSRRRPAAAHKKADAVGRGGFRQYCCCGSPFAVPARPIRPTLHAQAHVWPLPACIIPPRRRCLSPSRPASGLACPAPHRPGSPSPAASSLSAPPSPSPPQQWGCPIIRTSMVHIDNWNQAISTG